MLFNGILHSDDEHRGDSTGLMTLVEFKYKNSITPKIPKKGSSRKHK